MDEIESAKKELLDKLRSVQTKEDLEENIDEIKDLSEGVILAAIGKLEQFFQGGLPTDQVKMNMELSKLQDESYIFDPEMDKEMQRIAEIPGAEEFMDDFNDEMESRMTAHMEKFGELMMKLMENVMTGMMGGMAEAMGGMGEAMSDMAEEMAKNMASGTEVIEQEEYYEPSSEVKELTFSIPSYLNIKTEEELNENKDALFEDIDELFKEKIENIKIMLEMKVDRGEIGDEIKKISKTRTLTNEEIGKLIDRIEKRAGGKEELASFREEFSGRMEPIEDQIKDLKREFIQSR